MTIFSKIIAGEIPSYAIASDEFFFAFLDIFPAMPGHTLVVPKTEVDRLFDLPEAYLQRLLLFAQPVAKAIEKAFSYDRVNILTLGFEVPHAHVHLLPMNGMDGMEAFASKKKAPDSELKETQRKILQALAR